MSIKTLIEFGMTEKEAKVYTALLELETSGVYEISKKTGINRSSTYMVIESLLKKGLASRTADKKIQEYVAASPETLLQMATDETNRHIETQKKITRLLPELRAVHRDTKVRPKVYVYTGKEAIKQGYDEIYNEQVLRGMKTFRVFEDMANIKNLLPENFINSDISSIKKSGVRMRVISPNNPDSRFVIDQYKKGGSNSKFAIIPERKFNQINIKPARSFAIYHDKIDFLTKDLFLVVIESQEIADAMKNIFDLAWGESKRLEMNKKK